jgi:hypothetical protein
MRHQSVCEPKQSRQENSACSFAFQSSELKQEPSSLLRLMVFSLARAQRLHAFSSLHSVQKLDGLVGAREIVDGHNSAFASSVICDTHDLEQTFFNSGANGAISSSVPSVKRGLLNIGNGVNEFRFHDVSPKGLSGFDIVIQNQDKSIIILERYP